MENHEFNIKEFNEEIDHFIKEALNEKVRVTKEKNKKRKYRKHFELIVQLNSSSSNWEIILNENVIDQYETKEEAENAAEQLNYVYNLGLFEGIIQGKELQIKHDKEGLDTGIVMSIFETNEDIE